MVRDDGHAGGDRHRTRVTLRQVYPSQAARDEVIEKSGAIEGGRQHLARLEGYVAEVLAGEPA